jgi:DNA (cytosine-5)-methyltransferase 1
VTRLTYGSVCTGIGGFDKAFDDAGWECAWQIEIDRDCVRVLERHWPGVRRERDAGTTNPRGLAAVDAVVAGFPCQDLSVAGKRAGLAGGRSGLFFAVARLIAGLSPRWVVLENVPGLLSSWSPVEPPPSAVRVGDQHREPREGDEWEVDETGDLGTVLSALAELGYGWAYRVLDAQYFGLAQRRERVFVVGCVGDAVRAASVLFEPESVYGDTPPRREAGASVAALTARGVGTCGGDDNQAQAGHLIGPLTARDWRGPNGDGDGVVYQCQGTNVGEMARSGPGTGGVTGGVPFALQHIQDPVYGEGLSRCRGTDSLAVVYALTSEGADASEDGTERGTPLIPVYAARTSQTGANGSNVSEDVAPTLDTASPPAVAFAENQRGEVRTSEVAPQLTTCGGKPGQGYPAIASAVALRGREGGTVTELGGEVSNALRVGHGGGGKAHVLTEMSVRRLTPRECERLQGFPDDWTAVDADGKAISDSARYRMLGNAVAVPVARWIAERIRTEHEGRA